MMIILLLHVIIKYTMQKQSVYTDGRDGYKIIESVHRDLLIKKISPRSTLAPAATKLFIKSNNNDDRTLVEPRMNLLLFLDDDDKKI